MTGAGSVAADRKQYPRATDHFESFYERWAKELHHMAINDARRYRDRGWTLTVDDVESDMRLIFVRCWENWKPSRGPFGPYFYSCWRNHLVDLIRSRLRMRRFDVELTFDLPEASVSMAVLPLCPVEDMGARQVWDLLCIGYTPTEVRRALDLSPWQYQSIINTFRKVPSLHDSLKESTT